MKLLISLICSLFFAEVFSAPHKASLKKMNKYLSNGAVVGGVVGIDNSLLKAQRKWSAKQKMERLILTVGKKGEKRPVSYYHVEANSEKKYVLIHLERIQKSKVSRAQLINMFRQSPFVKGVEFYYDPVQLVSTIQLKLKQKVKIESFMRKKQKKYGEIVLDIKSL